MKERYEQIILSHGAYRGPIEKLAAALQARHYDEAERLLREYRPLRVLVDEVRSAFANPLAQADSYLSMCAALGAAYRSQSVKTVEDAVDACLQMLGDFSAIGYDTAHDRLFQCREDYEFKNGEYQVCTREEFEAEVKRREPEWTHETYTGPCKIIYEYKGVSLVEQDNGNIWSLSSGGVKPIKPTITKAQAWDMVTERGYTVEQVKQEFEVKL